MLLKIEEYMTPVYSGETVFKLLKQDESLVRAYEQAFNEPFTGANCDKRERATLDQKQIIEQVLKYVDGLWTVEEIWPCDSVFVSTFVVHKVESVRIE